MGTQTMSSAYRRDPCIGKGLRVARALNSRVYCGPGNTLAAGVVCPQHSSGLSLFEPGQPGTLESCSLGESDPEFLPQNLG